MLHGWIYSGRRHVFGRCLRGRGSRLFRGGGKDVLQRAHVCDGVGVPGGGVWFGDGAVVVCDVDLNGGMARVSCRRAVASGINGTNKERDGGSEDGS